VSSPNCVIPSQARDLATLLSSASQLVQKNYNNETAEGAEGRRGLRNNGTAELSFFLFSFFLSFFRPKEMN
jgi:hypothetical protein